MVNKFRMMIDDDDDDDDDKAVLLHWEKMTLRHHHNHRKFISGIEYRNQPLGRLSKEGGCKRLHL